MHLDRQAALRSSDDKQSSGLFFCSEPGCQMVFKKFSEPGLLRMENVATQLSSRHPICYDSYCLCDLSRDEKLDSFSVVLLKDILWYFEVPFASRNWKKSLGLRVKLSILRRMWISPLWKQVHKVSSTECIGRCRYGLTIFLHFTELS